MISKQHRVQAGFVLDPQGLGFLAGQIRAAVDRLGNGAVTAFTSGYDQGYQRHDDS